MAEVQTVEDAARALVAVIHARWSRVAGAGIDREVAALDRALDKEDAHDAALGLERINEKPVFNPVPEPTGGDGQGVRIGTGYRFVDTVAREATDPLAVEMTHRRADLKDLIERGGGDVSRETLRHQQRFSSARTVTDFGVAYVTTYAPAHRARYQRDERSSSRCEAPHVDYCRQSYHCPRHNPDDYVEDATHRG